MSNTPLDKNAKLQALLQSYIAQLPEKLAQIQAGWDSLRHNDVDNHHYDEVYRSVHSLAGSAGTFSFLKLSKCAREAEQQLKQWRSHPNDAVLVSTISHSLQQLQVIASQGPDKPPASNEWPAPIAPKEHNDDGLIYILEDDKHLAEEISQQLQHFKYRTVVCNNLKQATEAVYHQRPSAMVVDVHLQEGPPDGPQFVMQSDLIREGTTPIVYMSHHNDWETRLRAVRARGQAYLTKPIDFTALIEHLDQLTGRQHHDPYRILIVEDTELLAEHYASVLRNAGMQARVLTDPSELLNILPEFKPELILMDLYMPNCSGVEAAQVIRHEPSYDNIPIVYLSTENVLDRQLSAMGRGGDDFLQKPINDHHLVAAVSIRAQRFRALSSLMIRDSLTGLLNHITLKQNLDSVLAQAVRNNRTLSFAMLDIDHFKSINDTYGHPIGDKVIKSLARLLTDRLRKSDMIGRYGGEEFAVVLPDTEPNMALNVINQLREDFSHILYSCNATEFNSTFSAGIAGSPPFTDLDNMVRAADEALYSAKHLGRNRVELHKDETKV